MKKEKFDVKDLSLKPVGGISKKWYKKNKPLLYRKAHLKYVLRKIGDVKLKPFFIDFVKWVVIDFLRGKFINLKKTGIYQFVALPGEGKTLSMVAHIERDLKEYPKTRVYTNFNYKGQTAQIEHWSDMIKFALDCHNDNVPCILAMDEVHITFDSSDWRSFPPEMLSLISFNRKFGCQFLCSSQIYERIPKKIRDISNYTVLCKNVFKLDRLFINYYFSTLNYEKQFEGKRSKADYIRHYVADDYLYSRYNTLQQVDRMVLDASKEKNKREVAFDLLFGNSSADEVI